MFLVDIYSYYDTIIVPVPFVAWGLFYFKEDMNDETTNGIR